MTDNRFYYCASLLFITVVVFPMLVDSIGIIYGRVADNLLTREDVVPIVKSIGATKVKIYDAEPTVLRAFANTGVEFVVSLGNEFLSEMRDPDRARAWVELNVQAYLPATKITCIIVGNEVLSLDEPSLTRNLLRAMQSIHKALADLELDKQVTVSTAHSIGVLEVSYPPSAGAFLRELVSSISPILNFLEKANSPFLINAYPFFAYKSDPKQFSLDFALFQPNQGVVDPKSNLRYDNMLFAQIDAVYSALARLGYSELPVQVSETGWPSKGDADEAEGTLENARKFNGNLFKTISQRKGTPMRPNADLNIYVFALFNENMMPGPTSERNYGLFKADGTPVYSLGISGTDAVSTNITTTTTRTGPSLAISSLRYSSISGAVKERRGCIGQQLFALLLMNFWPLRPAF